MKTALIVGGNGIIGRNLAIYLEATKEWDIIITSYSDLGYKTNTAKFVKMDLNDPQSLKTNADKLKNVSHIFFAAYTQKNTPAEQVKANMALLKNLMDDVTDFLPSFEHITFIQGGKAYGSHLGIFKTPAKEADPRVFPPNFYYDQEDYLREKSKNEKWNWTALRPDMVIGYTVNNPMNLGNLIAVYGSFCKELDVPFRYPGSPEAYEVLVNATLVDVLSKGMEWAALSPNAKNEVFNISNGDVFRWKQVWPKLAEFFGVECAEPQTFSLVEYMADKADLWEHISQKYGLQKNSLHQLAQWEFGDIVFGQKYDAFLDVNKARRYGFNEMNLDSIDALVAYFQTLRDDKVIP